MNKPLSIVILAILLCASYKFSYAQAVETNQGQGGVRVKLSLEDNKSVFKIGERIRLWLEFVADNDSFQLENTADGTEPQSDRLLISPDSGFTRWNLEYTGGVTYLRDYVSYANLSTTPVRLPLVLNDSIRFDSPGQYTVKVETRRVSSRTKRDEYRAPQTLVTNEVSFEIQSMNEEDEQKEVKRLSNLLDARKDPKTDDDIAQQLSFLSGDASTKEKVRRYLNPEERRNAYNSHMSYGLFIARNRALVLQLLESAMRDPTKPVGSSLVWTLTRIRLLRERNGIVEKPRAVSVLALEPGDADPRINELRDGYVTELAAGLSRRSGKSQTTTAMTILSMLPKDPQAASAIVPDVRRVLVQQFDSLHPFDQAGLLDRHWDQIKDISLVPAIKKILSYRGVADKNLHDAALRRLIELDPTQARSYVIEKIRDPQSVVDLDILTSLEDKSLPEVDNVLLEQIRQFAASTLPFIQIVHLKQKTALLVRYGTSNIYSEVMDIYQATKTKLPVDSRGALIAYFAKHNDDEAMTLLEEAMSGLEKYQRIQVVHDAVKLHYSNGMSRLLKNYLESDEPDVASTSAYLIGKYGGASDQTVLERRLRRWREEWGSRVSEADTNLGGTIERELVWALLNAKSWKLSAERAKDLKASCLTKFCRQSNPVQ